MIQHLWQSTFFAIAVGLLTLVFRGNRANVRFRLWLTASLKFLIPFALLTGLGTRIEVAKPVARHIVTPAISRSLEQVTFTQPITAAAPPSTNWLPIGWAAGFLIVASIRLRGWLRIRALIPPGNSRIRTSKGVLEPGVVGIFRPILVLPEGISDRLSEPELRAVIAHEMCHFQRRDNFFATLHMIVEAVFWFHPFVWLIGARLIEERERACDEQVLSQGNDPEIYADAILNVCKLYTASPLPCVSGVSGASIRKRIEAIMAERNIPGLNSAKKLLLAAAGVTALTIPITVGLLAQNSPARPHFDVVSVRRCMPGDELNGPPGGRNGGKGRGPRFSPGRLRMQCLSLDDIIMTAYIDFGMGPLQNFQAMPGDSKWLRNAPAWVKTDWYTADSPRFRSPILL